MCRQERVGRTYYDPGLGRFLQADPLLHFAKDNGMNRYMYVGGQPTRLVDPTGLTTQYDYLNSIIVDYILVMLIWGTNSLGPLSSPGHNYSGDAANDFKFSANLASKDSDKVKRALRDWIIIRKELSKLYGEPNEEEFLISALVFFMMSQSFRPKPKGPMDSVSQQHDDSISTTLVEFKGKKDAQLHARGAGEFVRDSFKTVRSLHKWQVGDAVTFGVGVPFYSFYGAMRGIEYNIRTLRFDNFHKNGVDAIGQSTVMMNFWNPIGWIGATFIGRSPLKNFGKPGKWRLL
jgi:hypothetical protein